MKNVKFIFLLMLLFCSVISQASSTKKPKRLAKKPIINGSTVSSVSVIPYQVLLTNGSQTQGGGSIIAKRWILTAAHVAESTLTNFYAGVINKNNLAIGQGRTSTQRIPHPSRQINDSDPLNDVALIQVNQPFILNESDGVKAVKLASTNNVGLWALNQSGTVSGFGKISGGAYSDELRQVSISVTSITNADSKNKIRVGGNNNGNDSCQGDSGGPLVSGSIQIGTVCIGGTCGQGGDYMLVAKYLEWITKTIHENGSPSTVCGNTTFDNLEILPDGVSFQWTASPSNLFTNSSGSGLTFTTSNNGNSSGYGTVNLTVSTPAGNYIHSKQVWVGKPSTNINITTDGTFNISNSNFTSICKNYGYCMTSQAGFATSFTYTGWPSSNAFFNPSTTNVANDRICFGTNNTGSYYLTVNANNACGTTSRSIVVQVNNCGFRVFPNPAQTTLSIDFEQPDKLESIPDLIEIRNEKNQEVVKSKNMKVAKEKEKDNTKALSKIDFDVSDLPRGMYYLQIMFGDKREKKTEQIKVLLTDK